MNLIQNKLHHLESKLSKKNWIKFCSTSSGMFAKSSLKHRFLLGNLRNVFYFLFQLNKLVFGMIYFNVKISNLRLKKKSFSLPTNYLVFHSHPIFWSYVYSRLQTFNYFLFNNFWHSCNHKHQLSFPIANYRREDESFKDSRKHLCLPEFYFAKRKKSKLLFKSL